MSYESIKKSEHTKLGEAIHRLFEAYLKRHDISMEDLSKLKGPTPIHIDPQGNRELAKPTRVSDQRPARAHAVEDELEKPDVLRELAPESNFYCAIASSNFTC